MADLRERTWRYDWRGLTLGRYHDGPGYYRSYVVQCGALRVEWNLNPAASIWPRWELRLYWHRTTHPRSGQ